MGDRAQGIGQGRVKWTKDIEDGRQGTEDVRQGTEDRNSGTVP